MLFGIFNIESKNFTTKAHKSNIELITEQNPKFHISIASG